MKEARDSLAVLVLPAKLEEFELEDHARELLSIPRVVALEPSRVRTPRFLREAASIRQARRLRFPGQIALVVLYHPAQYPLAHALSAQYEQAELWYIPSGYEPESEDGDAHTRDRLAFDQLARAEARQTLPVVEGSGVDDEPLRVRLHELDVINSRPFFPPRRPRR